MKKSMLISIASVGIGVVVGIAFQSSSIVTAAPGTVDPPAGPVVGTGHTLSEIYDKIDAVESSLASMSPENREVLIPPPLASGESVEIGGSGSAVLNSAIIEQGSFTITDANGKEFGRYEAMAVYNAQLEIMQDVGTVQVFFDVAVELPLTVVGSGPGSRGQLVITRSPAMP